MTTTCSTNSTLRLVLSSCSSSIVSIPIHANMAQCDNHTTNCATVIVACTHGMCEECLKALIEALK